MIRLPPEQRHVFKELCGVLLPAWEKLPDGSILELQNAALDTAFTLRPELIEPFQRLSNEFVLPVTSSQVEKIQQKFPAEFKVVKLLVCATYYRHPEVKAALNYDGQQALTLPRGGFGCEELVLKMMSGGKRYRQTEDEP